MKSVIINVKDLRKTYKTHKRQPGLAAAINSIFKRQYQYKEALKGVSFSLKKGEIVGLIGPNGAGKSTTIKALSGVLYPSSGKVNVLGFTPWKDRVKYVANIGVVFGQKHQLWWDLPSVDTYELHKEIYNIPEKKFKQRLDYMVKLLDIQEVIKVPVRDLSLGERMKCQLVAALLHNPKLVFLDEPTIGLDVIAKDRMRDFIKYVNRKEGTTFIITTHDMQDIEKLCKRIIIINHGLVVYDGLLSKIRGKILKNKVIGVKLESSGKPFKFAHCKVIKQNKYEFIIEIDAKKQNIKRVIDHVISKYDVADIIISDPPIEKIIQLIYRKKEHERI